tara:strand:- start:7923 stop:8120 length:198 start_codon:yes stop_codon:yes gene_type:complete
MTHPEIDRLVGMRDLPEITGYSRRSIYRLLERDEFPQPIRINSRCNRWRLSAVMQWIDDLENNAA